MHEQDLSFACGVSIFVIDSYLMTGFLLWLRPRG